MGLHASKGGYVAKPIRAMTDEAYKGSCKTDKIEKR
jgi:hypothetical protein